MSFYDIIPFCQLTIPLTFQQEQNTQKTITNTIVSPVFQDMFQDHQQMPKTADSTKLYIHCIFFLVYTYL